MPRWGRKKSRATVDTPGEPPRRSSQKLLPGFLSGKNEISLDPEDPEDEDAKDNEDEDHDSDGDSTRDTKPPVKRSASRQGTPTTARRKVRKIIPGASGTKGMYSHNVLLFM